MVVFVSLKILQSNLAQKIKYFSTENKETARASMRILGIINFKNLFFFSDFNKGSPTEYLKETYRSFQNVVRHRSEQNKGTWRLEVNKITSQRERTENY